MNKCIISFSVSLMSFWLKVELTKLKKQNYIYMIFDSTLSVETCRTIAIKNSKNGPILVLSPNRNSSSSSSAAQCATNWVGPKLMTTYKVLAIVTWRSFLSLIFSKVSQCSQLGKKIFFLIFCSFFIKWFTK